MRSNRMALRGAWIACVLGMLAGAPVMSRAETPSADQNKAQATQVFQQGHALADKGDYAAACPKFEESVRLYSGVGPLLNLADCYEHLGRTASAWRTYKTALEKAVASHEADRQKQARAGIEALETRLPRLKIVVSTDADLPGLVIKRDGLVVPRENFGVADPLDPGDHTVEASAPGKTTWSRTSQLDSGGSVDVTVPVLKTAENSPTPEVSSAAGSDSTPQRGSSQRLIGLVAAGVGVVGIGVGSYFGLSAKSKHDDSQTHCRTSTQCDPAGIDLNSDAQHAATLSTITFGIGLVALAGGAALYFTSPRDSAPQTTSARIRVVPAVSPTQAGLGMQGTW